MEYTTKRILGNILTSSNKNRANNFIRNDFFSKNAKIIPHWILKQLKPAERKIADDMILNQGASAKDLLDMFQIAHNPYKNIKKPYVRWTKEQKINALKNLANEIGRVPTRIDFKNKYPTGPSVSIYHRLGGWNNALRLAGLEPTVIVAENKSMRYARELNMPIDKVLLEKKRQAEYKKIPEVRKRLKEYHQNPILKEKKRIYAQEYNQKPEVRERLIKLGKFYYKRNKYIASIGGKAIWDSLFEDQKNQLINKWKQEVGI